MAIYHLLDEQEVFSERNGGAISRWAANVLREGNEIVICPSFDGSWHFPDSRIFRLPNWSLTDPLHPILYRLPWRLQRRIYLRVFRDLLTKLSPGDLLYVHNRPECASVLATAAEWRGFQVVLHMHNSHLTTANRGQLTALKKTPIVFCSEFLRNEMNIALPGHFEQMYVVRNGADSEKFHRATRSPRSTTRIIWTGRIVPYKGVHVLVDAMRILQKKNIPARCLIVGGTGFGDSRSTAYLRKLKLFRPQNTEFAGYATGGKLAELLRESDIYCCPSIWNDPFPLAPLEAMATGLPIVATNRGGLTEMLEHGGGLLIKENDAEELAKTLQTLVENENYRRQLGETANAVFRKHFEWRMIRQQYLAVLDKVQSFARLKESAALAS